MDVEKEVKKCLAASLSLLSSEGARDVRHYLDHGEPEMAFEGLLLELINQPKAPKCFDYDEWMKIARQAGLDMDPVFDTDVLAKFASWANGLRET